MPKTEVARKGGADLEGQFRETYSAASKNSSAPGAVKRLRELLADCREQGVAPWRSTANPMAGVAAFILVKDAAAFLPEGIREVWAEHTRDLRLSLGHETAPPLERVLIEHVCACWLRLAVMELRYSAVVNANNTLAQVEHTERRLTEAQKRFNRACESLARVRKLSRPSVQINVAAEGGRQLNVA
jgi:hypothetical protein